MQQVIVTGSFDTMRAPDFRFLEQAAKLGALHVALWSDAAVEAMTGRAPKFPEAERRYFVEAIRYVDRVTLLTTLSPFELLAQISALRPDMWAVREQDANSQQRAYCDVHRIVYHVIMDADVDGFPAPAPNAYEQPTARKKVLVTGCYDWFHSGHVRFFEEAAEYGDLYVVVGSDANVALLKGAGHPLFRQDERCYIAQSIRFVTQALISTGTGWMDAAPEIARVQPDIYLVNEDGDKPEKRAFCEEHGLEYVVLKRLPKEGLTRRSSTGLRGF